MTLPFREERNELEEKRKDIDTEIEKIVQQKQEINEIEVELKRREEIIMKKEMLLNEKYELEMKKMRSSQILSKVCPNSTYLSFAIMSAFRFPPRIKLLAENLFVQNLMLAKVSSHSDSLIATVFID